MHKDKPDREVLERLYVEERKTLDDISIIYGVSIGTVHKWLKNDHIPRRNRTEQRVEHIRANWCPKDELERLYLVDKKSLKEIGKMFGVARGTVGNWAKVYNIPVRSGSEASLKSDVRPTKEELYKQYVTDEKTTIAIASMFGVHKTTVSNWLHLYEIDTRIGSEQYTHITRPTNDELRTMYVDEKMTLFDIAVACGTANQSAVAAWMRKANIIARTNSEAQLRGKYRPTGAELKKWYVDDGLTVSHIAYNIGIDIGTVSRWIQSAGVQLRSMSEIKLRGKYRPTNKELYKLYVIDRKSAPEIGSLFGVDSSAVGRWLTSSGVRMRTNSEANSGELSSNWKGGISFAPYCAKFNESFKEKIRDKYDRKCFLCGISEKEQMAAQRKREKRQFKLAVHHASFWKNCLCDNVDCEFVPLCIKCHGTVGRDRFHWYSVIMHKLFLESSADFVTMSLDI